MHALIVIQFVIATAIATAVVGSFLAVRGMGQPRARNISPAATARAWRDILLATLALLLVSMLMVSCTAGIASWIKPGASDAEMARDRNECEYEAEKTTPISTIGDPIANGVSSGLRKSELLRMCLQLRGFKPRA
jgi:hypothetical protein